MKNKSTEKPLVIIHEKKISLDQVLLEQKLRGRARVRICDKIISAVDLLKQRAYSVANLAVYVAGHSWNGGSNVQWAINDVNWIKNTRPEIRVIAWQEADQRGNFQRADAFVEYNSDYSALIRLLKSIYN